MEKRNKIKYFCLIVCLIVQLMLLLNNRDNTKNFGMITPVQLLCIAIIGEISLRKRKK